MLLACIIISFLPCIWGSPRRVPIGAIFDDDPVIQTAFELSVKAVNRNAGLTNATNLFLTSKSVRVGSDTFQASTKSCRLLHNGVAGIFGPMNRATESYAQSMCDRMEVPYIKARWDPEVTRGNAINLYPQAEALARVYQEMVKDLKWKSYAVLYDDRDSLVRIRKLLELREVHEQEVFLYRLGSGPNFRDALQAVKMSNEDNIVIDCSYENLPMVLVQAQQVGLMLQQHNIIVTSLDLHTIDLDPYRFSGVNVTGVRIIDPENSVVREIFEAEVPHWNVSDVSNLRVEAALAYDAVQLFARGLTTLGDVFKDGVKRLHCNNSETWEHGSTLSNIIKSERMHGLTGLIKFDTSGFRSEFSLDIISLNRKGLRKVGVWKSTENIQWLPETILVGLDEVKPLQDRHFIVMISLTNPYGMLKESSELRTGNDRYEGFAVDIIEELSKILGFNYTFQVQEDNVYGSLNKKTGQWNGMIRKILEDKAHLAITDLTITSERESAVDFTSPFMNLGISILYRKPTKVAPSWSSFLLPFSNQVWLYLIGSYIIVTFVLLITGRMSAVEWTNPYPCIQEPETLETPYTFADTPSFTIGSLLGGPSDIAPRSISTRSLATAWWCFCLIMRATYIANLAAALSTKPIEWPFKNVDELPYQTKITYGAKHDGSTLAFFKNATHVPYQLMYDFMTENPDVALTDSNEEGLRKVQQENYAYLMESSSIEYFTQRNCDVTSVGGLLDTKGYGIAMKKDVYYRHDLSGAILKLKEAGKIIDLQDKWWKQKRGGDKCSMAPAPKVEALNLEDVGGVFIVLTGGVLLSWVFTLLSFFWNIRNVSMKENVPIMAKIMEELKFLAKCKGTKTVRRREKSSETTLEDA